MQFDTTINLEVRKKWITVSQRNHIKALITSLYEMDDIPHVRVITSHPDLILRPYPASLKIEKDSVMLGTSVYDTVLLSLGLEAVKDYQETDTGLSFLCRFGGKVTDVFVPYDAVLQVGGSVSGIFTLVDFNPFGKLATIISGAESPSEPEVQVAPQPATKPVSHLRVVK